MSLRDVLSYCFTVDSKINCVSNCLVTRHRVPCRQSNAPPVRRMCRLNLEAFLLGEFLSKCRLKNSSISLTGLQLLSARILVLVNAMNDFLYRTITAVVVLARLEYCLIGAKPACRGPFLQAWC